MEIKTEEIPVKSIRFALMENGKEIGRAYLQLVVNGLHSQPYGLLEDVFVEEAHRGAGHGATLVKAVIEKARALGCYKLIASSRYSRAKVHVWYEGLGFQDYGKEFRINFG
jgi:GNAT superfamily N-acetyltransferase